MQPSNTVTRQREQEDDTVQTGVRVSAELWKRVKIGIIQHDVPMREFIEDALEQRLAQINGRTWKKGAAVQPIPAGQ